MEGLTFGFLSGLEEMFVIYGLIQGLIIFGVIAFFVIIKRKNRRK